VCVCVCVCVCLNDMYVYIKRSSLIFCHLHFFYRNFSGRMATIVCYGLRVSVAFRRCVPMYVCLSMSMCVCLCLIGFVFVWLRARVCMCVCDLRLVCVVCGCVNVTCLNCILLVFVICIILCV
jgi:hypothetical protein